MINLLKNKHIHRIAIYLGSFNPVHIGHVLSIQYAKSIEDFEGIFVIPCNSPLKSLIDFEHRLNICKLAFLNQRQNISYFEEIGYVQNNIVVSDIEKSNSCLYAIDTINNLKNKLDKYSKGELKFYFIGGSDFMENIYLWKNIEELKKIVSFFEIKRASSVNFDENCLITGVSSTEIRSKIKNHENYDNLVPKNVVKYIKDNKLYME